MTTCTTSTSPNVKSSGPVTFSITTFDVTPSIVDPTRPSVSTTNPEPSPEPCGPVTAIDPTAVTADGFGPVPGYDDGNPATSEQTGWRPLLTTPNHPEYPAAHGVITSAMAEVFSTFLGTNRIDLDIHGFDATGPAGNLNAVRHFDMPNDLRHEIIDARLWAGLHYHFSGVAGVVFGRKLWLLHEHGHADVRGHQHE